MAGNWQPFRTKDGEQRMPRRWPPDKTPEERLTDKGATVQDHLKAFARGVGDSLRWAFAEEDAALGKPKRKAQPRQNYAKSGIGPYMRNQTGGTWH